MKTSTHRAELQNFVREHYRRGAQLADAAKRSRRSVANHEHGKRALVVLVVVTGGPGYRDIMGLLARDFTFSWLENKSAFTFTRNVPREASGVVVRVGNLNRLGNGKVVVVVFGEFEE